MVCVLVFHAVDSVLDQHAALNHAGKIGSFFPLGYAFSWELEKERGQV